MGENYSSVQKLALAGFFIAGCLVLVGGGSPYWIVSNPEGNYGFLGNIVQTVVKNLVKGYMGLYMYCYELAGERKCEAFDMDNDSGWFHSCRILAAVCILLGCINGVCALCLACCTCCRRFILLGIVEFVAAVCGAFAAGSFAKNTETFTSSIAGFQFTAYGWGFYTFGAGVCLMGLVSFAACFASPDNPMRGMILSHAPASVVVQTSSSMSSNPYFHLQEQNLVHVPGGNGYTSDNAY